MPHLPHGRPTRYHKVMEHTLTNAALLCVTEKIVLIRLSTIATFVKDIIKLQNNIKKI
jgi:hypothetical protein